MKKIDDRKIQEINSVSLWQTAGISETNYVECGKGEFSWDEEVEWGGVCEERSQPTAVAEATAFSHGPWLKHLQLTKKSKYRHGSTGWLHVLVLWEMLPLLFPCPGWRQWERREDYGFSEIGVIGVKWKRIRF